MRERERAVTASLKEILKLNVRRKMQVIKHIIPSEIVVECGSKISFLNLSISLPEKNPFYSIMMP